MISSVETSLTPVQAAGFASPAVERRACFHCGEPCPEDAFSKAEKVFCCQGCLAVHDILAQSGLTEFYALGEQPGVRVRHVRGREQFAYLDEPSVQQRLLDFTDGETSRVTFHVPDIHCVACVWLLENLFRLNPAVGQSQVNFPKREVSIQFAAGKVKLSEVVALLASIGYEPVLTLDELEKPAANPARAARRQRWLQIGVAGFAFGNIMLMSLPVYFGLDSLSGPGLHRIFGWLSLALALPVVTFSASDYWKAAFLSIKRRALTLDVPIALGLLAIYGRSVFEIVTASGEGYCDSLTGLILFLLCGRVFQQKTHERLAFDRDYKSFFPLSVTLKGRAGSPLPADFGETNGGTHGVTRPTDEQRVSLSQLEIGDRILVRNHELIPADSVLISGSGLIDYSFVTGESEPVAKQPGDYLYAGGQQIGAAIELETVKPVSQSYLTSLWSHEAFQKHRDHDLNSITNRYSRLFTVAVIGIAAAAAIFWIASGDSVRGIKAFASVLIVACPCALALAAPFTLGTAQRWLAQFKIFLKNSLVLERMAQVDTIVFDKTGTLTSAGANAVRFVGATTDLTMNWNTSSPRPSPPFRMEERVAAGRERSSLGAVDGERELSELETRWIFSLTRHSTHPHAARIAGSFAERNFPEPVESFREMPGRGIEGRVQGREIWIGSRAWLESRGVNVGQASRLSPKLNHDKGERRDACPTNGSAVHVAIDGNYRGVFVLSSAVRKDADALLNHLSNRYEIALLSGDNERERESFRQLFGEKARLQFNQSPLDKLGFIRRLQESGKTVMMVGDGLNDAGALRQSDVGVAVTEDVGAFSPASDVIMEARQVTKLGRLLATAKRSTRIVRAGLAVSALYNVVGVSIAAAGLMSPVLCAVLMPLSSVTVVLFACGAATWAVRREMAKSKI
jgi:P-type Cu+ transporter